MIAYEEAIARLLDGFQPNPAERVSLAKLVQPGAPTRPRFAAAKITSPIPLPPFDNSAVDGYAVRAADTSVADAALQPAGEIPAGPVPTPLPPLEPGTGRRIFTGAPLPPGADAVIMQEDCEVQPTGQILILDPVKPWENIRFAGDDLKPGTVLLEPGDLLTPQRLALLQACGIESLSLTSVPTVALIASGSELRSAGSPLPPGCIHESNLGALTRLFESAGARVVRATLVADDPTATRDAIEAASREAQLVVTVGGASVGDHDLIKSTALEAGFRLDFWRIAMKPGKPFFAGRRDQTWLIGLPGNPVSAFATAVLLALPAVRQLAGSSNPVPETRPGILTQPLANPDSRRHFMRVHLDQDAAIRSTGTQGSHILSTLAAANGLVDVPPQTTLETGSVVRVIVW
jgi:molybdopterin molybdotransferase